MKKLLGILAVLGLMSSVAFAQEGGTAPQGGESGGGAPAADGGAPAGKHHGKKGKGKHHGKKKADAGGADAGAAGGASQ